MKFKERKVVNPTPDQGSFRQDPRSNFRINLGNKVNDFLYNVGWKSDGSSDGKGRLRKGLENVVVPAVSAAALSQAPIVAGAVGAYNLPGSYRQAKASFQDENATIGEKIRNAFPLAVNTTATVFGAVNTPRAVGRMNNAVRSNPPYTVQSHRLVDPYAKVMPSSKMTTAKAPNTVVQRIGKGEGHQGYARHNTGRGNLGAQAGSQAGGYQQASHVRSQAPHRGGTYRAQRPQWGQILTMPPMPYNEPVAQPQEERLQEVVLDVPYYGSPAFREAYGNAEKEGLSKFNFGGSSYEVKPGSPSKQIRTVTAGNVPDNVMDYPDYRFSHFPDSVSVGAGKGSSNNYVRDLNYGVSGVPAEETVSINKLTDIINKRRTNK